MADARVGARRRRRARCSRCRGGPRRRIAMALDLRRSPASATASSSTSTRGSASASTPSRSTSPSRARRSRSTSPTRSATSSSTSPSGRRWCGRCGASGRGWTSTGSACAGTPSRRVLARGAVARGWASRPACGAGRPAPRLRACGAVCATSSRTQDRDGGWGFAPGQPSSRRPPAGSVIGLAAAGAPASAIARGAEWIRTHDGQIQTPGDLERTILALAAARAPLGDLVERLDRRRARERLASTGRRT